MKFYYTDGDVWGWMPKAGKWKRFPTVKEYEEAYREE